MKLYLVKRKDKIEYNEYAEMVVIAKNEEHAIQLSLDHCWYGCNLEDLSDINEYMIYFKNNLYVEEIDMTVPEVVLGDFYNA